MKKKNCEYFFQNPKWKQEYAIKINNTFEILENMGENKTDNISNKKWESIKTIIKETKQQLIEKDERTKTLKNKWYGEKCNRSNEESKRTVVDKKKTGEWRAGVSP
jgi:hypothetical protein